ncbi:MAG: glycoside hydrolase family 2 protein [Treponema sp.]|nr:glycoside hydrolase family 2 protein [Treponema sp.]
MKHFELNGCWKLITKGAGVSAGQDAVDANVPGSVLDTWIRAGKVADPYYGENEKAITSLFNEDFEYFRTFSLSAEFLAEDSIDLVCLGIDTLGEIFINGQSIATVNNMHRSWRYNVKNLLKPGENSIRIVLFSPNVYIAKAYRDGPVEYINTGNMAGASYLRKTHCQLGWDWAPRLPDAGIWRDIYLEGWSVARIEDVYVIQEHEASPDKSVKLRVSIKVEPSDLKRYLMEGRSLKALLRICPPGSEKKIECGFAAITDITPAAEISCTIEKPQLWWPNGLGAQPLYGVEVELHDIHSSPGPVILDRWQRRIGLRTLTVSAESDQWGREFTLTVNRVKFFSMGANYIPEDSVFPRINSQRTRKLLEDCIRANFNTIRVWGGGYYPGDYFYDACDELGLVVWQDCMFACNVYELTDEFAANVAEEIRQNMIRLRHHACLDLWCGNNEMEEAWSDWDNVRRHSAKLKADYIRLFEHIIPEVWKKTDPQTFYWPASPSSGGGFDVPNDPDRGDVHYWGVWHGLKPFSEYRKYLFRFCSEFGFESLPDMETIRSFTGTDDINLFSPVLEAHQRCPGGNGRIIYYLSEIYRYPKDFDSLIYISQVVHLESIQSGVDHWRRHRGRCMGAVYWQVNDCWPVVSWSSIDYFGRWKALHYGARRFFAPVRATLFVDETEAAPPGSLSGPLKRTVRVFVHNDTMKAVSGTLKLYLRDRDFNTLAEETLDADIPALSAREVLVKDYQNIVNTIALERSCFAAAELILNGNNNDCAANAAGTVVSREAVFFIPPKHFSFGKPRYNINVSDLGDNFAVKIKTDTFCRFVRVKIPEEDVVFSDNYFDITGREGVEVLVPKGELKKAYTVKTLQDALSSTCSGKPIFSVGDSF